MSALGRICVVLCVLGCASTARAVDDAPTALARKHFERGAALYDEGKLAAAIKEFEAARAAKPLPALDYNIARSYDRMEKLDDAIRAYERYLLHDPPANDSARARLRVLKAQRLANDPDKLYPVQFDEPIVRPSDEKSQLPAMEPEAPAPVPAAAPSPERRPRPFHVAIPSAVAALAVGSLAAGIGLHVHAGQRYDELVATGCGATRACAEPAWSGARGEERAGIALMAIGGVALAADVALWVLWSRPARAPTPRAAR